MVFFTILLALLARLVTANKFILVNSCDQTLYAWEQGSGIATFEPILPNKHLRTKLSRDPTTGGKIIVVSYDPNGIWNEAPTLHFSYTLDSSGDNALLWYTLHNEHGVPFKGKKVELSVMGNTPTICPKQKWSDGEGDWTVKSCLEWDATLLRLCGDKFSGE